MTPEEIITELLKIKVAHGNLSNMEILKIMELHLIGRVN